MGLAARKIKTLLFSANVDSSGPWLFLLVSSRRSSRKKKTAATLCVRFGIIPSAGSLKLALRASDSQAPFSAEGMIPICFADPLSPANWRCHIQRVPDYAGLSLELRESGICDAVEASASELGKNKAPFPATRDLPGIVRV